jgi:hypothetical protein
MSSPANPPEITQKRVNLALESFHGRNPYPEDTKVISSHITRIFGINLPQSDTVNFWKWYSEWEWCSGWLVHPRESDIVRGFPLWIEYLEGKPF